MKSEHNLHAKNMGVTKVQNKAQTEDQKSGTISQSEKKRLQSLKERKEAFRAKGQAVQDALRNLDSKPKKNKIIFDEDIDKIDTNEVGRKEVRDLFDDEDQDDDEPAFANIDFEIKSNISRKPAGGQLTLGNDTRFKLDERFMDDDDNDDDISEEKGDTENNEAPDLQKEKEWQLDILGSVLGVPMAPKNRDVKAKNKGMIRYDPTENDHKEYEIVAEKSEPKTKKVKREKTKREAEVVENPPVEVSKDIYFSVSDSLTKSLKGEEQFSLLKTHVKEEGNEKGSADKNVDAVELDKNQKFQFNFTGKNPFKYDSSDDENEREEVPEKSVADNKVQDEQNTNNLSKDVEHFFFRADDARFDEAKKFFSKESVSYDEFKNLRRELKQIVRVKIRQNVNKNQPWGQKRKIRKSAS